MKLMAFADVKMALLAALIVLTAVLRAPDVELLAGARPMLPNAPVIETQVLTG